ncbi:MAG: hypothetical protein AAB922_00050 [Patescibacteria group bacterium]
MKTTGDIKGEFLTRNQSSTLVGFYTDAILNGWLDASHKWAAGYKKWPFTEGRVSTTYASLVTNEDGYLRGEYPEGWKPDSIRLLTIGGSRLEKKVFNKFQSFLEDNTTNTERMYTDFGLQYFINPNIDLSGTVSVWGQYTPADFDTTDDTVQTVFRETEEGNEAILEMMFSYAKKREKKLPESITHIKEAMRILDELNGKIQSDQFDYHSVDDDGMFKRIDVVNGYMRNDAWSRDQFN